MNTGFRTILLNFALSMTKDSPTPIRPNGASWMAKKSSYILPCKHQWQTGWTKTFTLFLLRKSDFDPLEFNGVCFFRGRFYLIDARCGAADC